MLHLHFLIQRKEGLSRKEFSDHWRNVHAPLAMQNSWRAPLCAKPHPADRQ